MVIPQELPDRSPLSTIFFFNFTHSFHQYTDSVWYRKIKTRIGKAFKFGTTSGFLLYRDALFVWEDSMTVPSVITRYYSKQRIRVFCPKYHKRHPSGSLIGSVWFEVCSDDVEIIIGACPTDLLWLDDTTRLVCEEYRTPVAQLPTLVILGKLKSGFTVLPFGEMVRALHERLLLMFSPWSLLRTVWSLIRTLVACRKSICSTRVVSWQRRRAFCQM